MRGPNRGGSRMWFNKGDTTPVYEKDPEDLTQLKDKYPPLNHPEGAFARLSKKQKKDSKDILDIEAIEREVFKCLNESTTRRLYQPSEQVSRSTQLTFRTKFVSE